MKPFSPVLCVCIALLGAMVAGNAQGLVTFDDLSAGGGLGPNLPVPAGYGGINWSNFGVIDGMATGTNYGYYHGVVSGSNVAFNFYGESAAMSVSSNSFDLVSAFLTSALNSVPTQHIQVEGFFGTTLLYSNSYTVNNRSPTLINFLYRGVQTVTFSSGSQPFAMDNVALAGVPEPGACALIATGIILAAPGMRNRKARRTRKFFAGGVPWIKSRLALK